MLFDPIRLDGCLDMSCIAGEGRWGIYIYIYISVGLALPPNYPYYLLLAITITTILS